MKHRFTTTGEAQCRALRRRDVFTTFILTTVTVFTVVVLLLAIRTGMQEWIPGHIVVSFPPKAERETPVDKPESSHSHAHYSPSAPKNKGGARARAIRAMTFSELSIPEPGLSLEATTWLASQDDSDFGRGVGTFGAGFGQGKFFGIQRSGARFAFVVDVSGSMDSGQGKPPFESQKRIDALKKQMRDSISALPKECEFAIVFFNDGFWGIDDRVGGAGAPSGRIKWKKATDKNKFQALDHIERTGANGGTEWVAPLAQAVKLLPKPEVLYLLSDGEPSDWGTVQRHLASIVLRGISVDTIALESDDTGANRLREVAAKTGGSYRRIKGGRVVDKIDSKKYAAGGWGASGAP